MKRETFSRITFVAIATVVIMATMSSAMMAGDGKLKEGATFKLTVLQTNDLHGQLDSIFNLPDGSPHENSVAKYSTIIKQVRAEEENVLVVDGGDLFLRGEFQAFQGEVEATILKAIGYDALVIGNNDFRVYPAGTGTPESRYDQLKDYHRIVNFPILCANVVVKETSKLIQNVKAYKIFSFDGVKVTFVGITSMKPEIRNWPDVADLDFIDPVQSLTNTLASMKQKSDINLVLSHAGNWTPDFVDHELAKVDGVSAVIGADSHKIIDPPEVEMRDGQIVPITQAGGEIWNYLGRLDLTFQVINNQMQLIGYSGFLYDITNVEADPAITEIIEYYRGL
jgi:5'-nucleotidase